MESRLKLTFRSKRMEEEIPNVEIQIMYWADTEFRSHTIFLLSEHGSCGQEAEIEAIMSSANDSLTGR
jgi:hypothetical protein